MTYTSNLGSWAAPASDRVDQGSWYIKKDEPFVAEYLNHVFYELIKETQWAIDRLNALDPDEDGQAEDAYTLRGKSPAQLGGFKHVQTATPTGSSVGESWLKDSNLLLFVYDGTRYDIQPEVGYDETTSFDGTDGFTVKHETPARTKLQNGSIMLIDEQVVTDFEDGDITPEHEDWSWSAGSANVSTSTTQVISGTTSGVQTAVGTLAKSTLTRSPAIIQDWEFSIQIGADTSNINDYVSFEVYDGSATPVKLATITFNDGAGNVTVSHGDGLGATTTTELMAGWTADTTYSFEFDWDFTNNQFTLLDGTGTAYGTFNFEADATASDFASWSIVNETTNSGLTRDVFLDDLHTGAREYGEAVISCPQPDTRIKGWDVLRFERTLATESVVVDVEDEAGTTLVSNIASNDDLSAYVSATTNPKFRIKISRTNTANKPSFDYLYRRWTMRPGDTGISPKEWNQHEAEQKRLRHINRNIIQR